MLRRLPALLVLLAVVVALWALFWSDATDPSRSGLDDLELETEDDAASRPDPVGAQAPEDEAPPERAAPEAAGAPEPDRAAPESLPTVGGMELEVTDKTGTLLERAGVTARILYPARPDRPAIHGVVEDDGAVFRFRELPLGAVQVHVDGDLVMPGVLRATIRGGQTSRRSLTVNRAGALAYDVQRPDGSRPQEVRLSLLDDAGRPLRARFRPARLEGPPTRPQQGRLVRMPPQGVVFGLRAGSYTLEASVPGGAQGAATASVSLGGTTRVTVSLEP